MSNVAPAPPLLPTRPIPYPAQKSPPLLSPNTKLVGGVLLTGALFGAVITFVSGGKRYGVASAVGAGLALGTTYVIAGNIGFSK